MYHYCNTRQPLVKDQYSKCILLTNQRLLRVVDGNLANKIYLPDVVSVVHRPTKPLQYEVLVFSFVSGFEDSVDIWNADVAEFFKSMVDATVRELSSRRKTRKDGDLEARAKSTFFLLSSSILDVLSVVCLWHCVVCHVVFLACFLLFFEH